jgi:hypothetical protein
MRGWGSAFATPVEVLVAEGDGSTGDHSAASSISDALVWGSARSGVEKRLMVVSIEKARCRPRGEREPL